MTSTAVTERMGSGMNVAVQNTTVRTDGLDSGFTKVMDSVSGSIGGQNEKQVSGKEQASFSRNEQDRSDDSVFAADRKDSSQKLQTETEGSRETTQDQSVEGENPSDQTKEALENGEEAASTQIYQSMIEQAQDLIEQAADSFSVDAQDVLEAMKQLDMNMTDILNPDRMQELALALAGEDRMSLLTDENLYQTVQELTRMTDAAVQNLQETFSLSAQDWSRLTEQTVQMDQGLQKSDQLNLQQDLEDLVSDQTMNSADTISPEIPDMQSMKGMLQDQNQESGNNQTDQGASSQADSRLYMTGEKQAQQTQAGSHEESGIGNENHQIFADTMMEHANELMETLMEGDSVNNAGADVDRIMKQILDYMKLQGGDQLSEIEMQLHPQSLGSLHISLASKNGIVTAQFSAQNEAVKEVLESQVMVLKENLEQQGVKVEAVEVTVASHEFERNLEEEAHREANQSEETEGKKKSARKFNLDDMNEEGEEDLDEADRITRDMMMRHGSKLDYLA